MKLGKVCRSIVSALLSTVLFISSVYIPVSATESSTNSVSEPFSNTEMVCEGDGYNITFSLVAVWEGGYNLAVSILNTGETPIENWFLSFDYAADITNIWKAEVVSGADDGYVVRNAGWNRDILPGETVSFGLAEAGSFPGFPENVSIINPGNTQASNGHSVGFNYDSEWGEGFVANITISNDSPENIEDWILEFDFDRDITSVWNAVLESHEGNHYVIKRAPETFCIAPGQSISFGFIGEGGASGEMPVDFILSASDMYGSDHTDPVVTEENPDGPVMIDDEEDNDGDGLSNGFESMIGTDPDLDDTDGDLLTDYQELYLTWTDPTLFDTDGNGISDADEDLDGDGLGNLEEFTHGTDTGHPDSDRDDLSDYDELYVHYTDPLNPDTDGDTLSDGDDVVLGFSPLLPDTDLNGISDADEKVYQTTSNDFPLGDGRGIINVSVSMNVSGNIDKEVSVINMYDFDTQSRDVIGIIGVPMEIVSDVDFDTAVITFAYDESMLGETSEDNLSLMWYDEENDWYEILDRESVVDTFNNTVSYTTTHFSTYLLVDRFKWLDVWNRDFDVPDFSSSLADHLAPIEREKDIVIISDTSAFSETDIINRQNLLREGLMNCAQDKGANVVGKISTQNGSGRLYDGNYYFLTGSREYYSGQGYSFIEGDGMDTLISPTMSANMDTVIGCIIYSFEKYPEQYEGDDLGIVIISSGSFSLNYSSYMECAEKGIRIYVVDMIHDTEYANLKLLSDATDGQYYFGECINDPDHLMDLIMHDVTDMVDVNDKDNDGLLDYYEEHGMICSNGRFLFSDPTTKHSDTDGLTDGQEVEQVTGLRYIGDNNYKTLYTHIMHSNPEKDDTDGDGIKDNIDHKPMINVFTEVNLSSIYNYDYLKIGDLSGGNQMWWYERSGLPRTQGVNYDYYLDSLDYRMGKCGCGFIAMTDLELYLAQNNAGYSLQNDFPYVDLSLGSLNCDEYMHYAEFNRDFEYIQPKMIRSDYLVRTAATGGIMGIDMIPGINGFLNYNGSEYQARWAGHYGADSVLAEIERMISNNIPVILSVDDTFNSVSPIELYYLPKKEDYTEADYMEVIFRSIEHAFNTTLYDTTTNGHYVTVVGVVKYRDDRAKPQYLLKVISWGSIYYLRYEDFSEGLSITQNIVEIK